MIEVACPYHTHIVGLQLRHMASQRVGRVKKKKSVGKCWFGCFLECVREWKGKKRVCERRGASKG